MPSSASRRASVVEAGCLAVILGVAIYTRLSYLNLVMFGDDEAAVSQLATALVDGHSFPLVGIPSSIGVNNPPMFVYLMAIPYAFSRDPELATGFIGLLGVLSVIGCYALTRAYFGATAASIASFLFAAHPWATIYARKIWSSDVMPVFALLFAASLIAYVNRGRSRYLILAFLWLALAVEVHFSGIVFVPVLVIALVTYRSRFRWSHVLAGAGVALATGAPYVLWQIQNQWSDLRTTTDFLSKSTTWDVSAAWHVFSMVASPGYIFPVGSAAVDWAYRIEGGLFVLGLAYAVAFVGRQTMGTPDQRRATLILLLWVLSAVIVFTRHSMDINRHYFVVVFPSQFIVIGVFLAGFLREIGNRLAAIFAGLSPQKITALGTGIASTAITLIAWPQLYAFTAYHNPDLFGRTVRQLNIGDIYNRGLPIEYMHALAVEMAALNAPHPNQPIYLQAPEVQKPMALQFLANTTLKTKPLGNGDGRSTLVVPPPDTPDTLFVTEDIDGRSTALLRSVDPTSRILTISEQACDTSVAFYRIKPESGAAALRALNLKGLSFTLDNGIRLIGYELPRVAKSGESIPLVLAWHVGRGKEASRAGYQLYAHLVDGKSKPWGGIDALDYSSDQWSLGETVISWFQVPVDPTAPPGVYHIAVGMYDHDGTRPVPMSDTDGRLVDRAVSLGPVKVRDGTSLLASQDATIQHRQMARLGDKITFLGYDLPATVVTPGQTITLTSHWVGGADRSDYTVFVHLVDQSGKMVAQVDSQPHAGTYPTSAWDQSEYVRDEYRLELPSTLPAGTYRILTGMYQLETLQRLPVVDEAGVKIGDSIQLNTVIEVR